MLKLIRYLLFIVAIIITTQFELGNPLYALGLLAVIVISFLVESYLNMKSYKFFKELGIMAFLYFLGGLLGGEIYYSIKRPGVEGKNFFLILWIFMTLYAIIVYSLGYVTVKAININTDNTEGKE